MENKEIKIARLEKRVSELEKEIKSICVVLVIHQYLIERNQIKDESK